MSVVLVRVMSMVVVCWLADNLQVMLTDGHDDYVHPDDRLGVHCWLEERGLVLSRVLCVAECVDPGLFPSHAGALLGTRSCDTRR